MKTVLSTFSATLLLIVFAAPCFAQFNQGGRNIPRTSQPKKNSTPFVARSDGTFKNETTGLVWLKNPTNIPVAKSLAEAKTWVAKLNSGRHGLTDGSKAGDWRLPTAMEWDSAQTKSRRSLHTQFFRGWPKKNAKGRPDAYSRGYIGTASAGDRWQGQYNLTIWGDGGRDSVNFGGRGSYIWPVRDSVRNGQNQENGIRNSTVKDSYSYDKGVIVISLDKPIKAFDDDHVAFQEKLLLKDVRTTIQLTLSVSVKNNYYSFELVTPGSKGFDEGGTGSRMGIFGYSDVWNLHRSTQTIYADGVGMQAALKDLQTKLNGSQGRLTVTANGDAKKGQSVITIKRK